MQLNNISFATTDWSALPRTEHCAEAGQAFWQTQHFGEVRVGDVRVGDVRVGDIRVRMVEYTAGYVSDHWCSKGHVLLCLEGELETELQDGRRFTLKPGMSYQVADNAEAHRSRSVRGARLFIVD